MPKVILLFQLLMYEHMSSAFMIAELELDNRSLVFTPCGHEEKFNVIAPNLCEPHISDVV